MAFPAIQYNTHYNAPCLSIFCPRCPQSIGLCRAEQVGQAFDAATQVQQRRVRVVAVRKRLRLVPDQLGNHSWVHARCL